MMNTKSSSTVNSKKKTTTKKKPSSAKKKPAKATKEKSGADLKSLKQKTVQITTKKKKNTDDGKYVTVVETDWTSPKLYLRKCYLATPSFFKGSSIPRYKIVCDIDSNLKEHKQYLKKLESIAKKNKVTRLGYEDNSGALCQIFQTKNKPRVYITNSTRKAAIPVELGNDLPEDTECEVTFDIRLYENRSINEPMFNFMPTEIVFYLDPELYDIGEL